MTLAESRTTHPLTMTTAEEVAAVREVLVDAGLLTEHVRYAFFAPEEPVKSEVLAGGDCDRRFRVVLLDISTGRSWDTVVSTDSRSVVTRRSTASPRSSTPSSR
ncbi:MAG: hypothetical protein ABS81_26755 [Pseudonocardia sp. SCN 72-86]|nr:MAG: hypothetical protein ABS81_26755 [Pseudonocardia sp. SCN 72-86]